MDNQYSNFSGSYRLQIISLGLLVVVLSSCTLTRDKLSASHTDNQSAIRASQAGASPLFFKSDKEYTLTKLSDFEDQRELVARDGLPNFFNSIRLGKPVTIAFIGGSITQMEGKYRNQTAAYMQSLYPKIKMRFINAGISGTGTDLGAARIDEQVLAHQPDLIFIDFAVNGSYLPGLEGMLRKVINSNSLTDICLLYAISEGQDEIYRKGQLPGNIKSLETVANYYHIPSVHMGIEPSLIIGKGLMTFKQNGDIPKDIPVFTDGIHPYTPGGFIYASSIIRSLQKLRSNDLPKKHITVDALFSDNWEQAKMLKGDDLKLTGSWKIVDTEMDKFLSQFAPWFPIVMQSTSPGAAINFKFKGDRFGIFDIGGPEVGSLNIIVDGQKQKTLNRFNRWCNNRYRGQYDFVRLPYGVHQVSIEISPERVDKAQILGKDQLYDLQRHPERYNQTAAYIGRVLIVGEEIK